MERAGGQGCCNVCGSPSGGVRVASVTPLYVRLTICDSDATRPSFATLVNSAIARSPEAPIATFREDEDSDDWLNVDAADFDAMLEKTMGTSKTKEGAKPDDTDAMAVDGAADKDRNNAKSALEDNMADVQASRLQDLAKKVEQFVEGKGDVEGAKFAECVS